MFAALLVLKPPDRHDFSKCTILAPHSQALFAPSPTPVVILVMDCPSLALPPSTSSPFGMFKLGHASVDGLSCIEVASWPCETCRPYIQFFLGQPTFAGARTTPDPSSAFSSPLSDYVCVPALIPRSQLGGFCARLALSCPLTFSIDGFSSIQHQHRCRTDVQTARQPSQPRLQSAQHVSARQPRCRYRCQREPHVPFHTAQDARRKDRCVFSSFTPRLNWWMTYRV